MAMQDCLGWVACKIWRWWHQHNENDVLPVLSCHSLDACIQCIFPQQRAQDDPPDEVVFGDPVDTDHESADEFVDCSEGGVDDDVFELLDHILASDGFVSVTP
jgi:hypothetical protein